MVYALCRGRSRGVALPPLPVYFFSRSQPPVKACHRSFFLYYTTTAVICLSSLGVVRWHHMTRRRILLHARRLLAACCISHIRRCLLQCAAYFSKVNIFQDTAVRTSAASSCDFHRWSGKLQASCHNFGCFW